MALGMEVGRVFTTLGFKVDDGDATAYERRVTRLRGDARNDITAHARVDADTKGIDNYERRLRGLNDANDNVVRGSGRVRGALGSLFFGGAGVAAAGIAIGGTIKAVSSLTGAFEESRKVGAQTNAVLSSTKHEAGLTAKEVGDLATQISRKTAIDDEAVQSAENVLLTFTNVRNEAGRGNDVFNQATKTIADMSVALGTDLQGSTIQVGKALNDPIKGITALSRVGVSFTKQQKDQIKTLVDSGKTLDAQKIILKELGKEFGGSAAAAATNSGKLRVSLGNVAETIGGKLNPYVQKGAGYLTRFIDQMSSGRGAGGAFAKTAGQVGDAVRTGLGAAFRFVGGVIAGVERVVRENRQRLEDLGDTVRGLARTFVRFVGQIGGVLKSTFGSGSGTGKDIRSIISALISFEGAVLRVYNAVAKRALPGIITAFRGLAQIIRGVIRIIAGVLTGDFGKAWDGVKDVFSGAIKVVAGVLRAATAPFRAAAAAVGKAVSGAFSSAWDGIVGTAQGFVNKIIDVINVIPGVNIGHVGGGGYRPPAGAVTGGGPNGTGTTRVAPRHAPGDNTAEVPGFAAGGAFGKTGGLIDRPIAVFGEEAPSHHEWVLPSNPAYRDRAIALWQAAARDLGIPGFALGGLFDPGAAVDFVKSLPGKAIKSAKGIVGSLVGQLPGNPGGILSGTFNYVKDKALGFIGDKATGLWNAAKELIGGKGVGGMTSFASKLEGMRVPYGAQGHGGWPISRAGEDCSSSVSKVLHGGGVNLPGVQTTVTMPSVLAHGAGKKVTVYNRPLPGNAGHMIMSIDGRFFGTSRSNPGGGPGWLGGQSAGYLATLPQRLHPEGYRTGGAFGPGGIMAYKKGGKTKKKAPRPTLTTKENRGIKRSVARGESGISSFEADIQGLEREYGQMDRSFGLSDEVFLIENDDGSTTVDQGAVNARVGELSGLIAKREEIKRKIEAYRRAIAALIKKLKAAIATIKKALKAATGKSRAKERAGYREAISTYEARVAELRGTHTDLGFDVEDQRIDLDELAHERAAVASTTGAPAPPADAAPADDASVAAADTTDPVAPEQLPPTAEDIARAAAEQLATFNAGRQDLFSSFGSTMEGARALAAGGLFGDTERRAAGVRNFGAFGGETLAPASQAAGSQITIHQQFDAPPPDPHVWAQGVRFEIEGAIG